MIRILLADDEPIALDRLELAVAGIPDAELVAKARNGKEALAFIRELKPDIAVLDIQMPVKDGFAAIAELKPGEHLPEIIFVTAYQEHAVRAFEAHAVDYLVKPFSRERFQETLRRARQRLAIRAGADADATARILQALETLRQRDDYATRIPVREDEKVVLVENGKALEKTVVTGRRGENWVEIVSGLNAGQTVVLDPAGLRTGQPVTVAAPASNQTAAANPGT